MKLIFNLKPNYSKAEVDAAKELLLGKNPTKKDIYSSYNIKNALAVAAIGEKDQYGLYPISQELHAHYEKFYALNIIEPDHVRESHSLLLDIQARLEKSLNLFIQDINLSNLRYFGAALAFYPDTFEIDAKHFNISEMLIEDYGRFSAASNINICIEAPKSALAYRFFFNMFSEDDLIRFFNVSSNSALSKYVNGRSVPSSLSWGLLLLCSGFHPEYELKALKDDRKNKLPLSQILFTTPKRTRGILAPIEMRYFHNKKVMDSQSKAVESKALILSQIKNWYGEGNKLDDYPTFEALLQGLESPKNHHPIFSQLIKTGLFNQRLRLYLDAFSNLSIDPNQLTQLMSNLAPCSAENLYICSNSNPYIYILMRSLFGGIENITGSLELTTDAWYKYEQSVRVATAIVWTAMLLIADLHPFYTLKKRKNSSKDKLAREIHALLKK